MPAPRTSLNGALRRAPGRRRLIAGAIALLAAAGCNAPVWYFDAGLGERLAKQENKPLLLYFKVWHSTHHRNMGLNVFSDPEVRKEMLGTINVELEYDWSRQIARKYGVYKEQVCVMCRPDGRKVGRTLYANPVPEAADFLSWFRSTKALALPPPTTGPTTRKAN